MYEDSLYLVYMSIEYEYRVICLSVGVCAAAACDGACVCTSHVQIPVYVHQYKDYTAVYITHHVSLRAVGALVSIGGCCFSTFSSYSRVHFSFHSRSFPYGWVVYICRIATCRY